MTQIELNNQLKSLGLPVAYHHFKSAVETPFIVYLFNRNDDLKADNKNYIEISDFTIELYTDTKDLETEKLVEDKLKSLNIPFSKLEVWIESENLYEVIYEITLI